MTTSDTYTEICRFSLIISLLCHGVLISNSICMNEPRSWRWSNMYCWRDIYIYIYIFFFIPHAASLVDLGKAWSGFLMGCFYGAFSTPVPGQVIKAAVHNCRPVGVWNIHSTSYMPAICSTDDEGEKLEKKKICKMFVRSITYYCVDYIFICIHLEDTDRCPVTELESAFSR